MPDYDHPGFQYWPGDAGNFPIGEITPTLHEPWGASGWCDIALPAAAPFLKTVAVRYLGLQQSAKLWFALECTTTPQGQFSYEAVLRAQHLHWWPQPGESGAGPIFELRIPGAALAGRGTNEAQAGHGPHCDSLYAHWGFNGLTVTCDLSVRHHDKSVRQYLADRAAWEAELEQTILEGPPGPEVPLPEPEPAPQPQPGT